MKRTRDHDDMKELEVRGESGTRRQYDGAEDSDVNHVHGLTSTAELTEGEKMLVGCSVMLMQC